MSSMEDVLFFSVVLFCLSSGLTSILLDLAARLFTPETPEVFCGLNTSPTTPSA